MGWMKDMLMFGQTGQNTGQIDPASGYPNPFTPGGGAPGGSGMGAPTGGIAPPPAGSGMNPQQFQQFQYLTNTIGMDPQEAFMVVAGTQQQPSGLATAARGLGPVAGAVLDRELNPRHLAEAPPVGVHVEPPGPLLFTGNKDSPMPATTTAAIIASLL